MAADAEDAGLYEATAGSVVNQIGAQAQVEKSIQAHTITGTINF